MAGGLGLDALRADLTPDQIGHADVVLLVDRLLPGIVIALQNVAAGIGLSIAGMIAAAFGLITPVEGAVLQEVIDVAVVLNALRARRIAPERA